MGYLLLFFKSVLLVPVPGNLMNLLLKRFNSGFQFYPMLLKFCPPYLFCKMSGIKEGFFVLQAAESKNSGIGGFLQ